MEERERQTDKADARFVDEDGVTRSPEGRAHYRRRKTIPEPVFGWIKQVIGFRTFSLRGIAAVSAEWRLMCTAVNLKRLHRLGWMPG